MKKEFYNLDCMDAGRGLPSYPDKYFDLAIVDPPYGEKCKRKGGSSRHGTKGWNSLIAGKFDEWNKKPSNNYFYELFRTSKNQIIWGANYFTKFLPASMGWIFWDKGQKICMSDGELAFTSFDKALRTIILNRCYIKENGGIIHSTQKPVALYSWLLENYAKPSDLILDTHVGSASSLIACEALGFDYVGYEIDKDYYEAATKRLEEWRSLPLFDESKNGKIEQLNLLEHE